MSWGTAEARQHRHDKAQAILRNELAQRDEMIKNLETANERERVAASVKAAIHRANPGIDSEYGDFLATKYGEEAGSVDEYVASLSEAKGWGKPQPGRPAPTGMPASGSDKNADLATRQQSPDLAVRKAANSEAFHRRLAGEDV